MFRKKMANAPPVKLIQMRVERMKDSHNLRLLTKQFNKFDKDKGGSINVDELGKLVRVLGSVFHYTTTT